jgi:hypothetical protein
MCRPPAQAMHPSGQYCVVIGGGVAFLTAMEPERDPELQKKAQRAQMLLYGIMLLFLVLPFILLWLKRRGVFHQ